MSKEKKFESNLLYSLMLLDDFKAILGIDDREDKLARFCLVTGTITIEQYCKRKLLRKKHFEQIEYIGDLLLPLREYPVISMSNEKLEMSNGEMIEPEYYRVIPDCGSNMNFPYSIELSSAIRILRCTSVKVIYRAGYAVGGIPADLSAACMELASWNMSRYRGRRVGMTGNIKGAGIQGEHFEMSIPENVKQLLETYKRKVI